MKHERKPLFLLIAFYLSASDSGILDKMNIWVVFYLSYHQSIIVKSFESIV